MRDATVQSVAVGFFDGVHVGHQSILCRAGRALTFRNHPLSVLAPERAPRLIMSPEEKIAAMRACGVAEVELVDFTPEFAALSPEDFAGRFFVGRDGGRCAVVCGENWRFGAGGRGNAEFLRERGFDVTVVPYAVCNGERVSSSRIRRSLGAGEIVEASEMLGRRIAALGRRFEGKGMGAAMGFPTVNLRLEASPASLLPFGVYEVAACGAKAVANYGLAPTMGAAAWTEPVLELHFVNDVPTCLSEESMQVEFVRFIRGEAKFASVDDLRRQIAADVAAVRFS